MSRSTTRIAAVAAAAAAAGFAASALAQGPLPRPHRRHRGSRAAPPSRRARRCTRSRRILTGRPASELPVDKLKVPAGFKVEVWAEGIPEARSLALGDKGTVFVSNRNLKNVYAITEQGGKREVKKMLKGLNAPNGVAFNKGTLYVAERHRITRYDGIEDKLDSPPEAQGRDRQPRSARSQAGHFWKFLAMGPDGKLYFNIGAPGNIVMPTLLRRRRSSASTRRPACIEKIYAQRRAQFGRHRLRPEDQGALVHQPRARLGRRRHARTTRCTACAQEGHELRLSVLPPGRLARSRVRQGPLVRRVRPSPRRSSARTSRRSACGSTPARCSRPSTSDNIFIAMHGSWNRTIKQGYNVMRATRRRQGQRASSSPSSRASCRTRRPIRRCGAGRSTCCVMKDGSLLVSDDYNGIIYRVSYGK